MANASQMGPPLSPRETRRSGRRSAQSASAGSSSKSPDSPVSESATQPPAHPPRQSKENLGNGHRPALSTHSSNGRSKRLKQEDIDDGVGEDTATSGVPTVATNGRAKRKVKDKLSTLAGFVTQDMAGGGIPMDDAAPAEGGEEEPSVTRCVCGSTGECRILFSISTISVSSINIHV